MTCLCILEAVITLKMTNTCIAPERLLPSLSTSSLGFPLPTPYRLLTSICFLYLLTCCIFQNFISLERAFYACLLLFNIIILRFNHAFLGLSSPPFSSPSNEGAVIYHMLVCGGSCCFFHLKLLQTFGCKSCCESTLSFLGDCRNNQGQNG